jgi:hypothetical protein
MGGAVLKTQPDQGDTAPDSLAIPTVNHTPPPSPLRSKSIPSCVPALQVCVIIFPSRQVEMVKGYPNSSWGLMEVAGTYGGGEGGKTDSY